MAEDQSYQDINYKEQGGLHQVISADGYLDIYGKMALGGTTPATGSIYGGAGSSSSKVSSSEADKNFLEFRFQNSATSGDNRGIYLRLYLTGAGGGGEALRAFTTVQDVAAGTAHGAHISLNFGDTGTVTGQGIAGRNTLHMPDVALTSNVTMAALQAEIYADGSDTDPGGSTILSFIRTAVGGHADGIADIEDDAAWVEFNGFTAASGNVIGANTADECQLNFTNWVPIRIKIGSTVHYLVAAQTVAAVSS